MFSGNSVPTGQGGAIFNPSDLFGLDGFVCLSNCTLTGNSALAGHAVFNDAPSFLNVRIRNSILWDNSTPSDQISQNGAFVVFSDIEGGYVGVGNIDVDPMFCDADGLDDIVGTVDDNVRLQDDSPCIDTASDVELPTDFIDLDDDGDTNEKVPKDLDFMVRQFDAILGGSLVDMGAYENQHVDGCPWDTGNPDIGAPPDGMVATQDLLYLLHNWGSCPGCAADFNCDLAVGTSDLLALLGNWGQ